ncbi:MAG: glucose-1-phosphate cytidylyltransferase [bacterium]|nr:glucose-1-phosphate cytidylyltransferase [bacterium]
MKVVILAGGLGTRISEESILKPKPMIEIGEAPIIWHIMKLYSFYGFNEFVICAGYKQEVIKEWFSNYFIYKNDVTFDFSNNNEIIIHNKNTENWKVSVIDTGYYTMTGGRLARVKCYLDDQPFMLTYGDGVSDIDINALLEFHKAQGKIATLSAVQPAGRFGTLDLTDNLVTSFREKSKTDVSWINGGFMVFQPEIFEYLTGDDCILEQYPLETLSTLGQLACYKHSGFWKCMDTLNDKNALNKLWAANQAPWKKW